MKIACERCNGVTDAQGTEAMNDWRMIEVQNGTGITLLRGCLCEECYDKLLKFLGSEK